MALRGKKPEERAPRLKALLFGSAGVGKTTAAIQMPKPYIIDTEDGSSHYGSMIEKSGGTVFATSSLTDVIDEVRALATEEHEYLTLVVDPFTTLYDTELEEGERKVTANFGRHYGYANKNAKRLYHLISQLDMNVLFTAHSKREYGDEMKVIGETFDGWKKLDYLFDLVFQLERKFNDRIATVRKTRLSQFPDQSTFKWSYENLVERYGRDKLERKVVSLSLATQEQVDEFNFLVSRLTDDDIKRLKLDKVGDPSDLHQDRIIKGIEYIKSYLNPEVKL